MRKLLLFVLLLLALTLYACADEDVIHDLSTVTAIEITCYATDGQTEPTVRRITNAQSVTGLCNTVSLLPLRRVQIAQPLFARYTLTFLDEAGTQILRLTLLEGTLLMCDGKLYRITNEADLIYHLENELLPHAAG